MESKSDMRHAEFVRIWRGRTTADKAQAYEAYWLEEAFQPLKARGALAIELLREDGAEESEFVAISYWASREQMTGGRGGDPSLTHHLERDAEFLVELPERVQVLRLVKSDRA